MHCPRKALRPTINRMFKRTDSSGCHRRSHDHGIKLLTRHHGLLHTLTGRFHAPGPHYWIGPANAGCVSHHEACRGADVTPHSLLRCLRIILTAEHRASNWQFCTRKEISLLVRRWVFSGSSLKPANDATSPTTSEYTDTFHPWCCIARSLANSWYFSLFSFSHTITSSSQAQATSRVDIRLVRHEYTMRSGLVALSCLSVGTLTSMTSFRSLPFKTPTPSPRRSPHQVIWQYYSVLGGKHADDLIQQSVVSLFVERLLQGYAT